MDFDISKLDTTQNKAVTQKAKPRFGPAARARPKAQVKPVEPSAQAEPAAAANAQPAGADDAAQEKPGAADHVHNNVDLEAAKQTDKTSLQAEAGAAPSEGTATFKGPNDVGRKFKPAHGKATDLVEGPESSELAADANQEDTMAVVAPESAAEDAADEAGPSTGPMTKAKKRKGLGKGSGAAPKKPKVALAEQTIDPQNMPLKSVIKVAMAKDKKKASDEQAAREAAGVSPGSGSRQRPVRAPRSEPAGVGAVQMQFDEHGRVIVDETTRTVQAQPQEEYTRREDGQHDVINSMTYMKREPASRWSAEETEEFFAALAIWGTNFNYVATTINTRMAALGVPHNARSRRQVKLKFNKEEKLHPRKIDRALKGQRAEAEDYIEIIHELKAQNQEEELAYLDAAPREKPEHNNDSAAETDRQGNASEVPADEAGQQAEQQAAARSGGNSSVKGLHKSRPHAKPRPQAGQQKAAPSSAGEGSLHQQESAPDAGQTRFTQMLQESGVTVADWQEEGVY